MEVLGEVLATTTRFVGTFDRSAAVPGADIPVSSSRDAEVVDCCLESSVVDDVAGTGMVSSVTTMDAPPNLLLFRNHVSSSVSMTYSKESLNSS